MRGLVVLPGCAKQYRPTFDVVASHPRQAYDADLGQCQDLASQKSPATGATVGAVAGGIAGAATGALVGGAARGAAIGASVGATQGAFSMGASTFAKQHNMIDNCMRGRGWAVL